MIVLQVLAWILFVGVSIEAGGFIVNAIFALVNPDAVKHLYRQVDLSALFNYDKGRFFTMYLVMSIVAMMRATLFYMIILLLQKKKLDLAQPFSNDIRRFLVNLSVLSFFIGLISACGSHYAKWLLSQGVPMPDTESLRLGGADVWIFMSVILVVIAHVFRRGVELQSENELTV